MTLCCQKASLPDLPAGLGRHELCLSYQGEALLRVRTLVTAIALAAIAVLATALPALAGHIWSG
jgi:hypothetical protein